MHRDHEIVELAAHIRVAFTQLGAVAEAADMLDRPGIAAELTDVILRLAQIHEQCVNSIYPTPARAESSPPMDQPELPF